MNKQQVAQRFHDHYANLRKEEFFIAIKGGILEAQWQKEIHCAWDIFTEQCYQTGFSDSDFHFITFSILLSQSIIKQEVICSIEAFSENWFFERALVHYNFAHAGFSELWQNFACDLRLEAKKYIFTVSSFEADRIALDTLSECHSYLFHLFESELRDREIREAFPNAKFFVGSYRGQQKQIFDSDGGDP